LVKNKKKNKQAQWLPSTKAWTRERQAEESHAEKSIGHSAIFQLQEAAGGDLIWQYFGFCFLLID
jgi:hypothetical protein